MQNVLENFFNLQVRWNVTVNCLYKTFLPDKSEMFQVNVTLDVGIDLKN